MDAGRHDTVGDWVGLVDHLWPEAHAESWDATGLQVGDPGAGVEAVLLCLDVTPATLDEAGRLDADLVIAHHPLLFRPLDRLTPATAAGQLALRAAASGIALLAAHTNFDRAVPGTSDPVAHLLELEALRPLVPASATGRERVKLVVFVPVDHTEAVLEALAGAGAGWIGEYDSCSFRVTGTGTFRPSEQANPYAGERGRLHEEVEDRLEIVVERAALPDVVAALRDTHPYEEVAFDVYPLTEQATAGTQRVAGLGLVGELPAPQPLRAVADTLALGLPSPHLRVVGDLDRPVRRVAVCGGAGDGLVGTAHRAGADVYVTGDLRHHPALDAATSGLALIDAGHYDTEAPALRGAMQLLAQAARDRGLGARLLASEVVTRPWAEYRPPRAG